MVNGSQVSVKWSVPNYSPQILTADGGVIAESSDGSAAAAFDAGGRSTGLSPLGEGSPYINWLEISVYSADPGASVASTTLGSCTSRQLSLLWLAVISRITGRR